MIKTIKAYYNLILNILFHPKYAIKTVLDKDFKIYIFIGGIYGMVDYIAHYYDTLIVDR